MLFFSPEKNIWNFVHLAQFANKKILQGSHNGHDGLDRIANRVHSNLLVLRRLVLPSPQILIENLLAANNKKLGWNQSSLHFNDFLLEDIFYQHLAQYWEPLKILFLDAIASLRSILLTESLTDNFKLLMFY